MSNTDNAIFLMQKEVEFCVLTTSFLGRGKRVPTRDGSGPRRQNHMKWPGEAE